MKDWRQRAACKDAPPDHFFGEPDRDTGLGRPGLTHALQIGLATCRKCPVREPCLEYALTHVIRYGIWGGTTQQQRRVILRGRRKIRAA